MTLCGGRRQVVSKNVEFEVGGRTRTSSVEERRNVQDPLMGPRRSEPSIIATAIALKTRVIRPPAGKTVWFISSWAARRALGRVLCQKGPD